MPEKLKPPKPEAAAYGARLKAIFLLSGASRRELSLFLKDVIGKQPSSVDMNRYFDGTNVVPRPTADAIVAFARSTGADKEAVDRLVNGTHTAQQAGVQPAGQDAGRAQDSPKGGQRSGQGAAGAQSAGWQAAGGREAGQGAGVAGQLSLGALRSAAQLAVGSGAKLSDYWQERRDELGAELERSEGRVASLKQQLGEVKGERAASAGLRRQLDMLRAVNGELEAEVGRARKVLRGRPSQESAEGAQEVRRQMVVLRAANQRLQAEVANANQALQRERELWEARAKQAEAAAEVLRGRLEKAAGYARDVERDLAERDAVLADQEEKRKGLEAELERLRIEADSLRGEVGRLGSRVLDLEEQLAAKAVSTTETQLTAPLPRHHTPHETPRETSRPERPGRRLDPPPRVFPPDPRDRPVRAPYSADLLDRETWDALWTPPPPPSGLQRLKAAFKEAFTPSWFLAGSTLLVALGTQIVGVTLYTLHVMISRGSLPPERAVLNLLLACGILAGISWATHRFIYKNNRGIGILAFIILTGCASLTFTGNTTTLTPILTEYAHTHGIKWADRHDGKSCDENNFCTPDK
ncbi:hypothetical protein [Streptomyces sp. NPDC048338]|uniref:hypothetical protein n=1 Tax=Streptomyces sp. NPDC048338 TaxID=3365536 RepID=UPI00371B4932